MGSTHIGWILQTNLAEKWPLSIIFLLGIVIS